MYIPLGCGAFKNPPLGQAKLWRKILFQDSEFDGKFKKIIFAIFDDHNTGKQHNPFGNYLPFIQTFDITQKRVNEFMEQLNSSSKEEDVEMKKNDGNDNDDDKDIEIDAFKILCEILVNGTDEDLGESRDLDYNEIGNKFGNNQVAMNILYCAGFKRTADGSRLQLELKRIDIAETVHKLLLQYKH